MLRKIFIYSILTLVVTLYSCNSSQLNYTIDTKLNPSKINPLSAILKISADQKFKAKIKVLGKIPVEQNFDIEASTLDVPVIGLYPNQNNQVEVILNYTDGNIIDTVEIKTAALPNNFATIEITKIDRSKMEPGFHACDIHYANDGKYQSCPMIFDDNGEVRWFLDLGFNKKMAAPLSFTKNGRIIVAGRHVIYEIDMLGRIMKKQIIDDNYGFHHDFVILPNNDLLLAVGKRDSRMKFKGEESKSDNDWIALWDSKTSSITKEWDLGKHLDVDRDDLQLYRKADWLHMNGLDFNPVDSTILISNKNQGLAKLSWDDKLKWILSPKKNWGKAGRDGNGPDTNPFLLTAIDADGNPYPQKVQDGDISADDFDFPWGNHAPLYLPNGNILVFDNGTLRNYIKTPTYSRAVEYKVNEEDMTVQQVWEYGKDRGTEFYSGIVSDVDYLPITENRLVTSGFIKLADGFSAKISEVNPKTNELVFEATLYLKCVNGLKRPGWGQRDILYRSERKTLEY